MSCRSMKSRDAPGMPGYGGNHEPKDVTAHFANCAGSGAVPIQRTVSDRATAWRSSKSGLLRSYRFGKRRGNSRGGVPVCDPDRRAGTALDFCSGGAFPHLARTGGGGWSTAHFRGGGGWSKERAGKRNRGGGAGATRV